MRAPLIRGLWKEWSRQQQESDHQQEFQGVLPSQELLHQFLPSSVHLPHSPPSAICLIFKSVASTFVNTVKELFHTRRTKLIINHQRLFRPLMIPAFRKTAGKPTPSIGRRPPHRQSPPHTSALPSPDNR